MNYFTLPFLGLVQTMSALTAPSNRDADRAAERAATSRKRR
jgi:hypothetical protein